MNPSSLVLPSIIRSTCAGLIIAFIAQVSLVTACSDAQVVEISNQSGWMYTVKSPGFPKNYPPSTTCTWTFTVPEDYELLIALNHFQLEPCKICECDRLHVSFTNHSIPEWRNYCGVLSDNYIQSLRLRRKIHGVFSRRMTVEFHSDESSQFKGFQGEIRTIAPALVPPNQQDEYCVNDLYDTSGHFSSPKYPDPYPANMSCTWRITVSEGKNVYLKFSALDLENTKDKDKNCANDYVEIREGIWGRRGGEVLGRFCGNIIPKQVVSPSNKMWVRFTSKKNNHNTYKGFKAQFKDSSFSSGSSFFPSFTCICFGVLIVLS